MLSTKVCRALRPLDGTRLTSCGRVRVNVRSLQCVRAAPMLGQRSRSMVFCTRPSLVRAGRPKAVAHGLLSRNATPMWRLMTTGPLDGKLPDHAPRVEHVSQAGTSGFSSASSSSSSSSVGAEADAGREERHEENADEALRETILRRALEHVRTEGWTQAAIDAAVAEEELSVASSGMFPNGPYDLVTFFMNDALRETTRKIREGEELMRDLSPADRLKAAIRIRLSAQIPYIDTWHQAMGLGLMPQNLPTTLNTLAETVDEMWHLAGDRTTDFNWYAKRAAVLGVYSATELYMLTDKSDSFRDTWSFLDRRMSEATRAATLPHEIQSTVCSVINVATKIFSGKR